MRVDKQIMPRGDRTGPGRLGPMTGRGLGYCAGYGNPGYSQGYPMRGSFGGGRGRGGGGRGYGRGPGYGWRSVPGYGVPAPIYGTIPPAPVSPENQLNMLKQEKNYLESQMNGIKDAFDDISKRIAEMEQKEKDV